MSKKIIFLFLFINSCLFAQIKESYAFDKITFGKINNTNINSIGNVFLIQNSKNSDYYLEILQYENGNKLAQLFHENIKRITFEFDIKFSKLEDIQHLRTIEVGNFGEYKADGKTLDSISFERDSIKNELIVRQLFCRKSSKKIKILKEFYITYSNADELLKDDEFIKKLKSKVFNRYLKSDYLKRFLNVSKNKVNTEIDYEKTIKYDSFLYLNE